MSQPDATPRSNTAATASAAVGPTVNAPFRGYFLPEDIAADRWVHLAALILCTVGIPLLLTLAGRSTRSAVLVACCVYSMTLVMLFACSTAFYHVRLRIERRRLRQLDHAAIFLLIAGTYTPFTALLLHGLEAVAITAIIWAGAITGAAYKLARPLAFPGFSPAGYLLLGGTALIGLGPVLQAVEPVSLFLIIAGMAIYALGAVIRRRRALRYRNTIWHMMVIAAASCHYIAILRGVVLATGGAS
ncbi:MAG TPA: hemolysin III family protein [Stellaceae bacterium]|nr:hemolysin III family protein [Stellaceae bacterium]